MDKKIVRQATCVARRLPNRADMTFAMFFLACPSSRESGSAFLGARFVAPSSASSTSSKQRHTRSILVSLPARAPTRAARVALNSMIRDCAESRSGIVGSSAFTPRRKEMSKTIDIVPTMSITWKKLNKYVASVSDMADISQTKITMLANMMTSDQTLSDTSKSLEASGRTRATNKASIIIIEQHLLCIIKRMLQAKLPL
mmetsp:Transcript_70898/g.166367  ORF Transcript_70898/g.166367 Transcript_70898/m.166367 type:complete len:200 (+) Transcript_70898:2141-2740(+)